MESHSNNTLEKTTIKSFVLYISYKYFFIFTEYVLKYGSVVNWSFNTVLNFYSDSLLIKSYLIEFVFEYQDKTITHISVS